MRILYIAGETVPGSNGGSVHVWEVASNLVRLGHHVTVSDFCAHIPNPCSPQICSHFTSMSV